MRRASGWARRPRRSRRLRRPCRTKPLPPATAADPVVADAISTQAAEKPAPGYGPSLDDLGITVRGVDQPSSTNKLLDGPVDSSASVAPADPQAFAEAAATVAPNGRQPPAHPHIIDASEGTPLDPLRNTTYDLNYAKTVPSRFATQAAVTSETNELH